MWNDAAFSSQRCGVASKSSNLSGKRSFHSSYATLLLLFPLFLFLLWPFHLPPSPSQTRGASIAPAPALRGLGTVYRRGTKPMTQLIVGHVSESTCPQDLKLFLRTLHRSGITATADLCLLFPWSPPPPNFITVIHEEDLLFHKLLLLSSSSSNSILSPFNSKAFQADGSYRAKSMEQPFWGRQKGEINASSRSSASSNYGSIVGFEVAELNPDDTFDGFIDEAPLQLQRWACYQMLLGMVRHKFKHLLLVEVSGSLVLGDPFASLITKKGGLYLSLEDRTWGSIRRSSNSSARIRSKRVVGNRRRTSGGHHVVDGGFFEKVYGRELWASMEEAERKKKLINSDCVLGGMHEIRGLANAMVVEIAKVAMQRKSREAFSDKVVLSYLLHKSSSSLLGKRAVENLCLVENEDSFVHSLSGSKQRGLFINRGGTAYSLLQGYNKSRRWAHVKRLLLRDLCSFPSSQEESVYTDCSYVNGSRSRPAHVQN